MVQLCVLQGVFVYLVEKKEKEIGVSAYHKNEFVSL
jgi:hypothetical protein